MVVEIVWVLVLKLMSSYVIYFCVLFMVDIVSGLVLSFVWVFVGEVCWLDDEIVLIFFLCMVDGIVVIWV